MSEQVTFTRAQDIKVGDTLKRGEKDAEVVESVIYWEDEDFPPDGPGQPIKIRLTLDTGDFLVRRSHARVPVVEA